MHAWIDPNGYAHRVDDEHAFWIYDYVPALQKKFSRSQLAENSSEIIREALELKWIRVADNWLQAKSLDYSTRKRINEFLNDNLNYYKNKKKIFLDISLDVDHFQHNYRAYKVAWDQFEENGFKVPELTHLRRASMAKVKFHSEASLRGVPLLEREDTLKMISAARRRAALDHDKALNEWLDSEVNKRVWFPGDGNTPAGIYLKTQVAGGTPLRETMEDPNFNWVKDLRRRLNSAGFKGQAQDEILSNVFVRMTYVTDTGQVGYLWGTGKKGSAYGGPTHLPFDRFFQMIAKQKVVSQMRDHAKQREILPTVSIKPSRDEESGGMSESTIPGEFDSAQSLERREEEDRLFGGFRDFIAKQRNADKLLYIFSFFTQGDTQNDIVKQTGLSTGQVNHWKSELANNLKIYAQGVTDSTLLQDLERLLKKLREPSLPKIEDKQKTWTSPEGDVKVTLKRRGPRTTRIILPDGEEKVVPNFELQ